MKKTHQERAKGNLKPRTVKASGFTLLELVVAFAIFLVIGGATMRLIRQQVPTTATQQDQSTLNLALRNSIAQIQVDVVNAGTGYYPGANIPDWPIGVTILNNVAGSNCYNASTNTYGPTCFDQLNVIATDVSVPPFHPPGTVNTSQTNTIAITPPNGISPTTFAASFHNGDELLWLQQHSGGAAPLTTTVLTADGVVSGSTVQLTYALTTNQGVNTLDDLPANGGQTGLMIASSGDLGNPTTTLTSQFSTTDWILKLSPIKYYVDASNPSNPKLIRQQGVHTTAPIDIIAQQVIGFKIGAMTWNNAAGDDQTRYIFNAAATQANGGYNNDWSTIRSVMVSVIGRTNPDQGALFHNTFDQGPYKVQAVSAVITPRNLSMNDQ